MDAREVARGTRARGRRRSRLLPGLRGRLELCHLLGHHRCPFGRRIRRSTCPVLQTQDGRALAHPVADLDQEFAHRAVLRCRDVHGGLVALKRDQRVIGLDRISDGHMHLDDRDILEVTDIRNLDLVARCHG
jgi:hypothetical protein